MVSTGHIVETSQNIMKFFLTFLTNKEGPYLCLLFCEAEVQVLEHGKSQHTSTFGSDAVGLIDLSREMMR